MDNTFESCQEFARRNAGDTNAVEVVEVVGIDVLLEDIKWSTAGSETININV